METTRGIARLLPSRCLLVLIELKKEDMEGVDTLRADYWKSRWAYPDEDA